MSRCRATRTRAPPPPSFRASRRALRSPTCAARRRARGAASAACSASLERQSLLARGRRRCTWTVEDAAVASARLPSRSSLRGEVRIRVPSEVSSTPPTPLGASSRRLTSLTSLLCCSLFRCESLVLSVSSVLGSRLRGRPGRRYRYRYLCSRAPVLSPVWFLCFVFLRGAGIPHVDRILEHGRHVLYGLGAGYCGSCAERNTAHSTRFSVTSSLPAPAWDQGIQRPYGPHRNRGRGEQSTTSKGIRQ